MIVTLFCKRRNEFVFLNFLPCVRISAELVHVIYRNKEEITTKVEVQKANRSLSFRIITYNHGDSRFSFNFTLKYIYIYIHYHLVYLTRQTSHKHLNSSQGVQLLTTTTTTVVLFIVKITFSYLILVIFAMK